MEAYLAPPPVNTRPGPEYGDDTRLFQGIPGIECAANGRLWAAWYGGRGPTEDRHNYVVLVTGTDGGRTWSQPKLVIDPDGSGPVRAYDPCLWHSPDGRMWLFWGQGYETHTDERAGVWAIVTGESGCDAPSWTDPVRIADGIMLNKPTVLSSGEWLLPVARWTHEGSSRVVSSADRGESWSLVGKATIPRREDRQYDEHRMVELRDGSVWMLVRTRYGIGESFSRDRGRTWTDVSPSSIPHVVSRFHLRRLRSGRMILVKHGGIDERTESRSRLTAFLSEDDGRTWFGGLLLDERDGVSYPDGVEGEDGTIFIIYDFDRSGRKEILMARVTEEDIARGGCSFSSSRRCLVNRATGVDPHAKSQ